MQKMQKKKPSLKKATDRLAVHKDCNGLLLAPTLCSERSATLSIGCPTREPHFIFGPAVAALRLAQIQTQTQIALRQIAVLASIVLGHRCDLTAVLPPHLALLSLLTRQQVSTFGLEGNTNRRISASRSAAMYHQQSQQQGSQPFVNASRPTHHPPSASQHPNHPNMQGMGFQFPRPNQLPDELESALSIRGTRDMDHRQMDLMNQSNQHQNQGTGIGQHGSYGSNPVLLPADNQSGHQQGVDWSNYQPPTKLFAATQQQQPQGSQSGARILNWNPPISDSPAPQTRQPRGDGGRMEGQGLYTPESAGSILASFGLSNDDLEVLSHYPDDQLTPDTLPFILRDIQLKKSGKQKSVSSTSSSSYSHNVTPTGSSQSHSAEVPSLLTVTQTAGKVIDYGHASRGTEESGTRETFKREQLSSERTVKMLPTATSSSVSKVDKTERRHVHVEHKEPIKHGDRDYRKTSCEKRKNSRSPVREFAPLPKTRNLDRDYRQVESKQRLPSETRSEDSSRRSPSSSSASRHGSSKKLPTPTMISDFAAVSPKVFPHTCSLCHIQCDQEKDWVDHINTVDHTAACRDLRNKYPDWKPNLPSRSWRYGSRSPFGSAPRSHSRSPTSPHGKYRREPFMHRPHGRPYSPPRHPRPHYHTDHGHWNKYPYSGSHGPRYSHREPWPDRRHRESSGGYHHHGVRHPHDDALTKSSADRSRNLSSSALGHGSKHAATKPSTKTTKPALKPATKTTKAAKNLPVKKKKKVAGPASQGAPFADRLVYLTGIPIDATEQEVTDLVSSFGKINNVILLPCSEEESEKGQGQKASVCMMKTEDAQALASASELCIREQPITALVAKKPEDAQLSEANSKAEAEKDKESAGNTSAGGETDQKTSDQKWNVLVTGLPDSGWSDADVAELVQSVGAPSDIILAKHVGKALVSFPDLEVAEELVKVHSFKPAMFKDTEVKMTLVKKQIGLSTPVALYNLFTGSLDPLDGSAPVGWNSLVVIKNVPDSPGSSTEVLKLMRRFGTVIKFLVVNSMIICEMATTAMALSVYKRFLMFPCIIQNNPLVFYRKADPKAQPPTKIIPACCETAEDKPPEDTQAAAEPSEQDAESQPDHCEDPPEKDEDENTKTEEKTEEENLAEMEGKDDCVEEEEEDLGVSVSSPASDAKPDEDAGDAENTEVHEDAGESEVENVEETQAPSSYAGSVSPEMPMPELPKMTQAMVNALLEECRTRTANKMAAPPSEDQGQTKREQEDQEKTAEDAIDTAEGKDEEAKKLDRERKEREMKKEKERKERERREREREMERRERREWEKKEWERRRLDRRERRRSYDRSFGSRSSYRLESYRQRDERYREAERRKEEPEEPEEDEFPFNMSDFVTVDELGDVTELPDAAVSMETSDEGETAPPTEQEEEHMEISVEATAAQQKESDEKEPEHVESPTAEAVSSLESGQDPDGGDAPPEDSHVHTDPSETADRQSDDCMKPDPDAALPSSLDFEPVSTSSAPAVPAPSTCSSTAVAEEESSSRSSPADHDEAQNEEHEVKNEAQNEKNEQNEKNKEKNEEKNEKQSEEHEAKNEEHKEQNEEKSEAPNEESNKPQQSQDEENMNEAPAEPETSAVTSGVTEQLPDVLQKEKTKKAEDTREESVKKPLPPYDPSAAVGLEYLVPKTGFFCKVCSRFFTGAKAAEISHCKTLKHYENLQKFLQSPESSVKSVKTNSS
uniref:Zinc finger protein 638-like n=2 Tax=Poecilia formosa TaxID=48698 RepID=A0A096M9Z7_POEFO